MRCLPPPPPGRSGWPWDTVVHSAGMEQPRITIITPSFGQAAFIEETIRSVLLQGWDNLEFIIVDGGSADGTVEILKKYEPWLAWWVSETDRGQADAINKGLRRATGQVVTWFNSDDVYAPGIFAAVARAWAANPHAVYAAAVSNFYVAGQEMLVRPRGLTFSNVVQYWTREAVWHDPGLFWSRAAIDKTGEIDSSLRYSFDFDYLARALQHASVEYLDEVAAGFRLHRESKTISQAEKMMDETAAVSRRYWDLLPSVDRPGFERYWIDSRLRLAFSHLRRLDPAGLRILRRLAADRPGKALRRVPVAVAKGLLGRFRRFRSVRHFSGRAG